MCNHEQIKSVNGVISCMKCGEILPLEFLTGKKSPAPETPVKTPKKRTTKGVKK